MRCCYTKMYQYNQWNGRWYSPAIIQRYCSARLKSSECKRITESMDRRKHESGRMDWIVTMYWSVLLCRTELPTIYAIQLPYRWSCETTIWLLAKHICKLQWPGFSIWYQSSYMQPPRCKRRSACPQQSIKHPANTFLIHHQHHRDYPCNHVLIHLKKQHEEARFIYFTRIFFILDLQFVLVVFNMRFIRQFVS